jgi:hypothetical protein
VLGEGTFRIGASSLSVVRGTALSELLDGAGVFVSQKLEVLAAGAPVGDVGIPRRVAQVSIGLVSRKDLGQLIFDPPAIQIHQRRQPSAVHRADCASGFSNGVKVAVQHAPSLRHVV